MDTLSFLPKVRTRTLAGLLQLTAFSLVFDDSGCPHTLEQ